MTDYERSMATLQVMEAVGHYLPFLKKLNPDGTSTVVAFRFGEKVCRMNFKNEPYMWVRGSRWIPSKYMYQVVHEILAIAERERTENGKLREELASLKNGRGTDAKAEIA